MVGHSHNFCITFTPAHLVGRINCKLTVMWLGWFPNSFIASVAWLKDTANSDCVSLFAGSLSWGYPFRFQGVSNALGFYLTPKLPLFLLSLFQYLHSPIMSPLVPVSPTISPPEKFFSISLYQKDGTAAPLAFFI